MDAEESALWMRYRVQGDPAARDQLFSRYLHWAASVARTVHLRVRAYHVDRDDFVQNAQMGLLDAISRYDPERGVAFPMYAKPRVRGAVFNGLKAILGERPTQDVRPFSQRLESISSSASTEAFEEVVDSIVGLGMGYLLDEAARFQALPFDAVMEQADAAQTALRVQRAVGDLTDRLQLIIRKHYFEHVPFQNIAEEMGVTKGRVSQLHHAALLKLREALRK